MRIGTPGFIPARLIEGREARGLTQTCLAERSGIKSQSISHYEQGRQSPSPQALTQLSAALHLPARFFLRRLPTFQHLAGAPRLAWTKEIVSYLRETVELPATLMPKGPAQADDVRQAFGLGFGPIENLLASLEGAGCIVTRMGADNYAQWDFEVPFIGLNAVDTRSSWVRYAAAKLLGALALRTSDTEAIERFARAFLLPARSFGSEVWAPTVNTLLTLKREWKCPLSVMVTRCGEIGVFDEEQMKRASSNVVRRGWKAAEPREDDAHPETPQLLARSVQLLIEEGIKDRQEIAYDLAMNPLDVEDICGLPRGYLSAPNTQAAPRLRRVLSAEVGAGPV